MAEEMIYIPMRYRVDLDKTINTTPLNTLFAMGDNQAHRFELTITHGTVAVDLTGCTVNGKFVSFSNNMTVNLNGSVTGSNAVVTLTQACYAQLGRFALVIQINKDSSKTTVFYGDGYMRSTTTDNAIDGNYIVYDTNVLLSKIQEIENAISGANAAISNANAAAEHVDANMDAKITARVDKTLSVENGIADAKMVGEEIGSLKDDLDDVSNVIYDMVEIDNGLSCRVASGYAENNISPSSLKAIGTLVTINDPIIKIVLNNSASSDDTLYCDITDESGTKVYASSSAEITTEKSNIVLDFPKNRIVGNVRLNFYTKNKNAIGYFSYPTAFIDSGFLTQANDGKYYYYTSHDGIKYIKFDSELRQNMNFRLYTLKNVPKKTVENVIYVSIAGNDETGDGSKEKPYATIYHANELITDNSESNPYKIIVANGTYTDLQERYAGIDGTWYQGVICKSHVTYQSEDINRPDLCILEWDGSVGYEKPVTNNNCVNKCIFHIKDNTQGVHIKGFTFKSKNTRYCMHIETVGATMACDWHFENCVFEWGGRPDEDDDGTVTRACVGTGYSMLEFGEFVNCIFKCTNTNSANHMIFQTHDNTDPDFSSIKCGEHIRFENCFFSVADGSAYAHFDLRQTINTPQIKSFVELINCSGLPIYAPSTTYNKSFVCTEQHT